MPGWHEKTEALQEAGKLQMVGIIEEQHPDRTRLFMQWKDMGWPLLIDSLNLLDVSAVPLTYLVDEAGVVRYERPTDEDLETFLSTDYKQKGAQALSLDPSRGSPEHVLLWGDDDVSGAIVALGRRIVEAPEDSRAHFRLGVAYRKRYDSDDRRAGDFQKAVEHWVRALELDPNQYIFRRRIQQYGPRLDKPYPFYDWVPEARAAVESRGDTPIALRVEPGGAEFAEPLQSFAASTETRESPDPEGRIFRDEKPLIIAETVVVPTSIEPGESGRIHVAFRPDLSLKAHWNNEVDDLVFWVDPPAGWQVDRRHHTVAIPREPVSQELRQVEFEIATPEGFQGTETIPAYALYYVCEDVDGTCLFRRQDVDVEVSAPSQEISAPVAKIVPKELEAHGDVRIDNYYWLRERENPEVIAYLEAENAYLDTVMGHTKGLQETLFEEIVSRIKQDDATVPYLWDGYYYYARYEEGKEYPIYCRKKGSLDAPEEIMVDANELAEGHDFFSLRGLEVSSGRDIAAFGFDTAGRRFYTVRFKNLTTGTMYPDVLSNVTANGAWANDNKTYFYTKQDSGTLRWDRIYRHELGTAVEDDVLVYEESDETFSSFVFKTKTREYLIIGSAHTLSSEYRFRDADRPVGEFSVIQPRERDHEYGVAHFGDKFYIYTNWNAPNFKLMETPVGATEKSNWKDVIPGRGDVMLERFEIFEDYLALVEQERALNRIRVIPWSGEGEHFVEFDETAYMAYLAINEELDTEILRYGYSSLTTPLSTYDYNMRTREQKLLKREEVVGGYDPSDYVTERLWAKARDGVEIPISIVYPKGLERDGSAPLLLYAYGSYGASEVAAFYSPALSLLERGFVYAIAHIRGGQEMGRSWYEDGKLLKKKNTFTDFIDSGKFLIAEGYTRSDRLFATGASAGGLLMGAVVNMAPEIFRGVIADVPYVDAVTTMLDPDIPLTTSEYDEWGDPGKKEYYDYMLSYSPYDNVQAKDYPNLLVTTALADSQVQYWEPAKWVAKLRALKTDDNLLLLKTNMDGGHGGPSGRFHRHRETALGFAFLLDLMDKQN